MLPAVAHAHTRGLSRLSVEDDALTLVFSASELGELYPLAELDRATPLLVEDTWRKVRIAVDGEDCALGEPRVEAVEQDGIALSGPLTCPAGSSLTVVAGYLPGLEAGHETEVEIGGQIVALIDAAHPIARASVDAPPAPPLPGRWIALGAEHVVTGWDHLAFLLGLLLVARSFREMAGIVTGFTVAHSITLSAMALGWVAAPAAIVEPAIALTVAFVGLENLLDPPAWRRLLLTVALGLVHGFGFAGMLVDLGLPADGALVALLGYNLGVELGQLAIVALALPLLLRLRRDERWLRRGVPALSLAIALLGVGWFVTRLG